MVIIAALRMLSSNVYSLLTFCAGQGMLGCTGNVWLRIRGNDYRPPACLSGLLSDQKLVYNEQWPNAMRHSYITSWKPSSDYSNDDVCLFFFCNNLEVGWFLGVPSNGSLYNIQNRGTVYYIAFVCRYRSYITRITNSMYSNYPSLFLAASLYTTKRT